MIDQQLADLNQAEHRLRIRMSKVAADGDLHYLHLLEQELALLEEEKQELTALAILE